MSWRRGHLKAGAFVPEAALDSLGVCCGGAPHHVRSMAEALGTRVPATKYSPDLSQHEILGSKKAVKKYHLWQMKQWTRHRKKTFKSKS